MSQKILRFGVIGCGLMGREFASATARWAHLLEMEIKPEIVAVCDTNPKLMEWFSSNFESVKQSTTDFKALLENPEVDAVYCAVPHNLHEDLYIAILKAGKHLLGEKPFGMNLAQNTAILEELKNHPEIFRQLLSLL